MKNQFTICVLLLVPTLVLAQDTTIETFSYTELFEMIEAEQDSVFELKDAIVRYTPATDSTLFAMDMITRDGFVSGEVDFRSRRTDTIIIHKELHFKDVQFFERSQGSRAHGTLAYMKFLRPVRFENVADLILMNSTFEQSFSLMFTENFERTMERLGSLRYKYMAIGLSKNKFKDWVGVREELNKEIDLSKVNLYIEDCTFNSRNAQEDYVDFYIALKRIEMLFFDSNSFDTEMHAALSFGGPQNISITNNQFGNLTSLVFDNNETERFKMEDNEFGELVGLRLDVLNSNAYVSWVDLQGKIIHIDAFRERMQELQMSNDATFMPKRNSLTQENANYFLKEKFRIKDEFIFKEEMNLRGKFFGLYKARHDNENANRVYVEMKDMETERLEYLYSSQPSFKTFFTWKTNQFLKVFSAYGTEPARSIIFSLYVILCFAFIYLFFPNSWDRHGKNRLVDRYNFFFKYMKRKAGIHEVYLEDHQEEMMTYDQFKENITNSKQKVPRFFTATALPLYRWAVSGTKLSASILKRIDIMKGTWSELPKSKRVWKSVLLVGAFLIAVVYDIFIKMLNALMLSINTFTTLGFGEIPIKGLPRYLAIIQGFIGWFMLTIFSVSLISQLLN
jgi:hypothetical protein